MDSQRDGQEGPDGDWGDEAPVKGGFTGHWRMTTTPKQPNDQDFIRLTYGGRGGGRSWVDPLRQTGRTTKLINDAPHGAFFYVGEHARSHYVRALLHHIGRPDIRLISKSNRWFERLQGCRGIVLIVDHDVWLTDEEYHILRAYGLEVRTNG